MCLLDAEEIVRKGGITAFKVVQKIQDRLYASIFGPNMNEYPKNDDRESLVPHKSGYKSGKSNSTPKMLYEYGIAHRTAPGHAGFSALTSVADAVTWSEYHDLNLDGLNLDCVIVRVTLLGKIYKGKVLSGESKLDGYSAEGFIIKSEILRD